MYSKISMPRLKTFWVTSNEKVALFEIIDFYGRNLIKALILH